MQISLEWLNQYIDISDLSADEIAVHLTDLGLEVEAIHKLAPLDEKVVVGKVLKANQHPEADKLRVCEVDVGSGEPLHIVCGAPNAREGIYVLVAIVGAKLPGDFKIKATKIRGEKSQGMMCSGKELEISDDHEGIIELKEQKLGVTANQALHLEDTILELSITPNRSDCNSYIGIARDLSAKLGRELKIPELQVKLASFDSAEDIAIEIDPNAGCGRFVGLSVRGVKSLASPAWMQRRLNHSGMRPINLIVDATNYAMLETGQPIHAYDKRFLKDGKIGVRQANKNEKLLTLDGEERTFEPGDLIITDGTAPIGIAGIMGGQNSEVKDDTNAIIIEVAHFDSVSVRKTARRMTLHTEASHRFERGIDIQNLAHVAYRVADLINMCLKEHGVTSEVAGQAVDVATKEYVAPRVALRVTRARRLLGLPGLSNQICRKHLESLGLKYLDEKDERMLFEIPSWRHDMEREADLIEEVARLEGFDKVPYELPVMNIAPAHEDHMISFQEKLRHVLAQTGLSETISFAFVPEDAGKKLRLSDDHPWQPSIELANPLIEEQKFMQPHLLYNLLAAASLNKRHGNHGVRLFELGRGFTRSGKIGEAYPSFRCLGEQTALMKGESRSDQTRVIEHLWAGGILTQPHTPKTWQSPEVLNDFHTLRSILQVSLGALGGNPARFDCQSIDEKSLPFLHPANAAAIYCETTFMGYMGEVHPEVAIAFDLDPTHPTYVFEWDVEAFATELEEPKFSLNTHIWRYPGVTRDFAFEVAENVTHRQFDEAITGFKKRKYLQSYELFDVYQGERVDDGKKSMGYAFTFRSTERTLTDKEVEKEVSGLLRAIETQTGATLR